MTQLLTVQTDFRDIEQMAQGLVGRVHATHVILPTGDAVDEGEWAQFEVTLFDGDPGLAGVGRCVTVVDNGDERLPHQRFDVVLDSLQFDDREQTVFEHILAVNGEPTAEEPEDVDAESLPPGAGYEASAADDVSELTGSHAVSVPPEDDEQTMIASTLDLEPAASSEPEAVHLPAGGEENDVVPHTPAAQPGRSSPPGPGYIHVHGGGAAHAVVMPIDEGFEEPLSGERIAPTRPLQAGLFVYAHGLEFPARPPRPDIDATLRVTPAPRPSRQGQGG